MTKSFGLDANNDIYLGSDDNIVVLSGEQAVRAACVNAARTELGEMVLAINGGLPNFKAVFVGAPNYAIYENYLRTELQNVEGVIEVESLEILPTGDALKYTATIKTQYGRIAING